MKGREKSKKSITDRQGELKGEAKNTSLGIRNPHINQENCQSKGKELRGLRWAPQHGAV